VLAAARERDLGYADTVVQRRLAETARMLELSDGPSIDASRHATSLRLDDGDPIVARRLVQQMKLQLEAEARRVEPTDAELRAYLLEHAERFTVPERVRVQQVFFSVARRGPRAEADARAQLNGLINPIATGDPSLWRPKFDSTPHTATMMWRSTPWRRSASAITRAWR
jgi:hypothetical protein